MTRLGKAFIAFVCLMIVLAVVLIATKGPGSETGERRQVQAALDQKHEDAAKAKEDDAKVINARLNSGSFADTTYLHWSYDPDEKEYEVYTAQGHFCGSFKLDELFSAYAVYDPLDPETDKLNGHNKPHLFPQLEDARAYLWSRCEMKRLATEIQNANLAPGEVPNN